MGAYSTCKALVVGVGRYADSQYDLSYARSDAEAMADLLGNEFGFDQVWTLYDQDATRQNLIRFFEQDLQRTDEDDGLLIFFAGHGITVTSAIGDDRGFLVPYDGNPKEAYANLSLTTIRDDYLPMIPAKHVFLIVDACYGGLALRDVSTVERPGSIDEGVLAELTRRDRKVRQVLAAGTKEQKVLDGGLFGHSVFTGRLIEALREANPYITADHVGVLVRERVARDSLDRKHRQTPQFGYLFGGEGAYVFCRTGIFSNQASYGVENTSSAETCVKPVFENMKQWYCVECRSSNPLESKACRNCGDVHRTLCNVCVSQVTDTVDYCPTCGAPFSKRAIELDMCNTYAKAIEEYKALFSDSPDAQRLLLDISSDCAAATRDLTLNNAIERKRLLGSLFEQMDSECWREFSVMLEQGRHEILSGYCEEEWTAPIRMQRGLTISVAIKTDYVKALIRRNLQLHGPKATLEAIQAERDIADKANIGERFQREAFGTLLTVLDSERVRVQELARKAERISWDPVNVCPKCDELCLQKDGLYCDTCKVFVHRCCLKQNIKGFWGIFFSNRNDLLCPACNTIVIQGAARDRAGIMAKNTSPPAHTEKQ